MLQNHCNCGGESIGRRDINGGGGRGGVVEGVESGRFRWKSGSKGVLKEREWEI